MSSMMRQRRGVMVGLRDGGNAGIGARHRAAPSPSLDRTPGRSPPRAPRHQPGSTISYQRHEKGSNPVIWPYLRVMKSRVYLVEHLSADELYRLYREEKDAIRRPHLQALWLVASGRPAKFAAAVTGYTQRWLSVLIGRYNEVGVEGLGDWRQFNPGSRPLLDADKRERLDRALGSSAARGRLVDRSAGRAGDLRPGQSPG